MAKSKEKIPALKAYDVEVSTKNGETRTMRYYVYKKIITPVLFLSIFILNLTAHAGQSGLTAGTQAYARGDYRGAVREYASAGARGQFIAGMLYYNGSGITRDLAQAALLFKKAADQGHAEAAYRLGGMYEVGYGVKKDVKEAFKWYRKAAETGDPEAESRLGFMYKEGKGVTRNSSEAAKWIRKAATHGSAEAQYAMGTMLEKGQGMKRDTAEAAKWFRMVARKSMDRNQSGTQLASCDDPALCVTN